MLCIGVTMDHTRATMLCIGATMDHTRATMRCIGVTIDHTGATMRCIGVTIDHTGATMPCIGVTTTYIDTPTTYFNTSSMHRESERERMSAGTGGHHIKCFLSLFVSSFSSFAEVQCTDETHALLWRSAGSCWMTWPAARDALRNLKECRDRKSPHGLALYPMPLRGEAGRLLQQEHHQQAPSPLNFKIHLIFFVFCNKSYTNPTVFGRFV